MDGVKYHIRLSGQEIHEMYFSQKIQKTTEVPQSHLEQERDFPDFHLSPTFSTMLLRFNLTHPELRRHEVRQALAKSLDRHALVAEFCRSHQIPAHSLVPPMFHFYNSPSALPFDLDRTRTDVRASLKNKQLLSKLTLIFDAKGEKKQVASWIAHQWKKRLGIDVHLQELSVSEYIARESALKYDLSLSEWYGDYLYPTTFLNLFRSDSGTNRTGFRNSNYDELLNQAGLRTDRRIKIALLQEAEALLMQELPILPLFHGAKDYLLSPNVKGIFDNSLFFQPNKTVEFK
jgi:oligopeptide transport system substrate-binding protein